MCSRVPFCCFHSLRQVSVDEDLCADPEKGHVSSSEVLQDRHSAFSALHVFFCILEQKARDPPPTEAKVRPSSYLFSSLSLYPNIRSSVQDFLVT